MIFDTDILIWVQRGNVKAARLIEEVEARAISAQSYMELLQGAVNQQQQSHIKQFLHGAGFEVLPLSARIGQRAMIYIEEYSLSHGLRAGDAVIAATAAEYYQELCTGNGKHFKAIKDLSLKIFKA